MRHDEPNTSAANADLFAADPDGLNGLTLQNVGKLFPIKQKRCYFNNASIGAMSLPVIAAVDRFLGNVRDNGRNDYPNWCRHADTEFKDRIARLIGAKRSEIAYVKNTTEGLVTVANGLPWKAGDNVILADIEYPSNVYCWMRLKRLGVEVRWVKNRAGRILVDDVRAAMDGRTRIVSLSAVQFSNGYRHDIASTATLCREKGALFNIDAIQWVGALKIDVEKLGIDFMSVGGHKWMLAPIGTGIFYCRSESLDRLDPPSVGYHTVGKTEDHMDYELVYRPDAGRFEEALVNFPGIWGLDAAVRVQLALTSEAIESHILGLTSRAAEGLRRRGYDIVSPFGDGERSGNLSFSHPRLAIEDLEGRLRSAGIDLAIRGGKLRISPSYYNDTQEIDRLLDVLPSA
ncbi:aminotransferase class V-fold PLP-dependent enzyme [Xanthobacteraceae bacterium Astr-EGSB]|uniref:aminotransferase class V-fold PLP-dependent enzyme n=1 Tax=Astrobacterium formosum TaxID=3069710 RepID=UPI0027AEF88E|nr:aminotransferase class V-fold PLP-dependent enzyme [Xanthobacteraceae bacterium Astr-EGSB]